MRAFTQVSVAAPDYALRVPSRLRLTLGAGGLAGLAGIGILAAGASPIAAVPLVGLGAVSAAGALSLGVITSTRLRTAACRRMLESVAWRGDERVLDVGCGNGFLLVEIAKRLRSGSVTGIDLWMPGAGDQTAELAWHNARLEGVEDRVEICNVDARTMPFGDASFDVIVCSLMLHHAGGSADRQRVLDEMARVVKPGGMVLLYDVAPLLGGAATRLQARGLEGISRRGRVMSVLSARRPAARGAAARVYG
jgi:SAM-dependent methyltransferase